MHQTPQHPEVPSDPRAAYAHLKHEPPRPSQRPLRFLDTFVFFPPSDLKRFSDSSVRTSKLSTYVNFPLKELEMREFATTGGGE